MNFRNVEESVIFEESQFTKRIIFNDDEALSFVLNFKHGQVLGNHNHENSAVIMIVLQGKGQIQVNDERQKIHKGSAVFLKGKEEFSIPVVDEDLSIFVTITPKPHNTKYSEEIG